MKTKNNTLILAESGIMIALSCALFALSKFIPWPAWIQGGSVTLFAQVPIIALSYRRGLKAGIPAALVLGVFKLVIGLGNFAYVKGFSAYITVALFDYLLAYGVLGLGGIFRRSKLNDKTKIVLGALSVCILRLTCHFISGVTVWRDYTQSLKASVIYSITYNGGYMLPETVITVIGCIALMAIIPAELNKFIKNN